MEIDVATPLLDLEGNEVKNGDEVVTAKKVMINSLMGAYKDEESLEGTEKVKRYKLAQSLQAANGKFKFSQDDAERVKKLVNKMYTTLIVGAIFALLEETSEAVS